MKDIKENTDIEIMATNMQTIRANAHEEEAKNQSEGDDVPPASDFPFPTSADLAKALSKPEVPEAQFYENNPNIKGRIAYSLAVYSENSRLKII